MKEKITKAARTLGNRLISWADSMESPSAEELIRLAEEEDRQIHAAEEILNENGAVSAAEAAEEKPVEVIMPEVTETETETAEEAEKDIAVEITEEVPREPNGEIARETMETGPETPEETVEVPVTVQEPDEQDPLASFHISQDPRIAEEQRLNEEAEERSRRKRNKKLLILIPVVLVLLLAAATVPPFLKTEKAYRSALQLLEDAELDAAQEAFTVLGDYSDSREKSEKEIPYRKAVNLLKYAQHDDAAGLELAGISAENIPEDSSAQLEMYRKTIEMFTALEDFKDSAKKIAVANAGIDEYYDRKNLEVYNEAADLLKERMYVQAREMFLTLGNYRDSADLAEECIYRRADAILGYAEKNNVRNISLKLSNDPEIKTQISIPKSLLVEEGGSAVALIELKDCCGQRCSDLIYEDVPGEGFMPLCEAVAAEFNSLGKYKDSAEKKQKAEETGDFTREFFEMCRYGQLGRARDWLKKYDDAFEGREAYSGMINLFLPYCGVWKFNEGDPTLIPYAAGEDRPCETLISAVTITEGQIALTLTPMESDYAIELEYVAEVAGFRMIAPNEPLFTFALITENGMLTVSRLNDMGFTLSVCEYAPA